MFSFILENMWDLIVLINVLIVLELVLRFIPTRKPINILALFARALAKLAVLIKKIGDILPERRKK